VTGILSRRAVRGAALTLVAILALAAGPALGGPRAVATNLSDITVIPATGGEAIAASPPGGWAALIGPTLDVAMYSNPDRFPEGTAVRLELPRGYEWDTTAVAAPAVDPAPGMPAGFCSIGASRLAYEGAGGSSRVATFTLLGTHDIGCRIVLDGLRVRWAAGATEAPAAGELAVTWTVPGLGSASAPGGTIAPAAGAAPADGLPIEPLVVVLAAALALGTLLVAAARRPAAA
jgi:hypothetical protein